MKMKKRGLWSSRFRLRNISKKTIILHFFKWDPHPVVVEVVEEDVDDLSSTRGWRHQKSGNAYEGDEEAIYVSMKKLAVWSCKPIFDKQDKFVHPGAIVVNNPCVTNENNC